MSYDQVFCSRPFDTVKVIVNCRGRKSYEKDIYQNTAISFLDHILPFLCHEQFQISFFEVTEATEKARQLCKSTADRNGVSNCSWKLTPVFFFEVRLGE